MFAYEVRAYKSDFDQCVQFICLFLTRDAPWCYSSITNQCYTRISIRLKWIIFALEEINEQFIVNYQKICIFVEMHKIAGPLPRIILG